MCVPLICHSEGKHLHCSKPDFTDASSVESAAGVSRRDRSLRLGSRSLHRGWSLRRSKIARVGLRVTSSERLLLSKVDGWIARKWPSQRSSFGTVLDPIADKLLVTIFAYSLAHVALIPGCSLKCVAMLYHCMPLSRVACRLAGNLDHRQGRHHAAGWSDYSLVRAAETGQPYFHWIDCSLLLDHFSMVFICIQRSVKKYFDVGSGVMEVKPLTISKVHSTKIFAFACSFQSFVLFLNFLSFPVEHNPANRNSVHQLGCSDSSLDWRTVHVVFMVCESTIFDVSCCAV